MTLGHKGTVAAWTFRQKSVAFLFVVCNLGSACVHVYTVCVNPAIAGKSNKPLLSRQLVTGSSCSVLLMNDVCCVTGRSCIRNGNTVGHPWCG